MSTDRRIAGLADDEYAITATIAALTATTHPTIRRSVDPPFLPSISHPPDLATHVVAHQQRAVRQDQQANRPAPARAVGALPAYDEVFDAGGAPATAVHLHAHDLGAGRDGPVPGPVQRHERRAAIVAGELRARVEREAERRGVGLHGDGGRLDLRAVSRSVLGIGLARQITLWPPVVAAVLDDVDMLGGHVVAEVVALVAQVTRRAGGHVHLAIRPEQNGPRRVAAATRNPSDRFAFRCTGTESLHGADVGDVHRVAAERDAERSLEAGGDRHGTFGDAVVVRIGEFDDHAGSRLRRVHRVARSERQKTHPFEVLREHRDRESWRKPERLFLAGRGLGAAAGDGDHGDANCDAHTLPRELWRLRASARGSPALARRPARLVR